MKHRTLGAAVALATLAWTGVLAPAAQAQPVALAPPNVDVAAVQAHLTQFNGFATAARAAPATRSRSRT
ncbi:hypothetical protein SUDANB95_01998 [Actinosynnema sp. ALI-1.44]